MEGWLGRVAMLVRLVTEMMGVSECVVMVGWCDGTISDRYSCSRFRVQ